MTKMQKATTSNGPLDPEFVSTLTEPLSPKDKKVIEGLAEGKSLTKAAEDAGMSPATAKKLLTRADVQTLFRNEMESQGLTLEFLAGKLKEGLEATEAKISKTDGIVTVPDFKARHKYLDTALKAMRAIAGDEKKSDDLADRVTVNINLSGDDAKPVAGKVIDTKPLE